MDREAWLSRLGARCVPTTSDLLEAQAKLADYLDGLKDLPDGAFTQDSFEAASRAFEFFPAYAPLRRLLETHWREHGMRAALPAPDSGLSEQDRIVLAMWHKQRAAGFPPDIAFKDLDRAPTVSAEVFRQRMAIRLGWMQRAQPQLYAYLVRTDAEAQDIAKQRGWLSEPSHKPSDEQAVANAKTVAAAVDHMRASRHGVPPPPVRSPEEQREAVQGAAEPVEERPGLRPLPEMTPERKRAFLSELRADPRWPNRAVRIRRLCAELGLPVLETDPPVPEVSDKKSDTPPQPPEDEQPANDRGAQRAAAAPTPKPARRWVGPWHSDPDEPPPDPAD